MATKLTGDDHFILGISTPPKDVVQGTGDPALSLDDNECAIWINTAPTIGLLQSIAGSVEKLHRFIQSENLKDTAVAQWASMPIGGSDTQIAAAAPGAGEVGLWVGADTTAGNKSHFLDRTYKRLLQSFLEAGKLT